MKIKIVKFGGAVITADDCENFFNEQNTARLARELYPHRRGCVLIHGTGLVGKPPAKKHGYSRDGVISARRRLLAVRIRNELRRLNQRVVETLVSASVPAIPFDSAQWFNESMEDLQFPNLEEAATRTLENGLVPVFYGDLLPRRDGSFRVLSSDVIGSILSRILRPDTFLFLTDVEGVYSKAVDPKGQCAREVIPSLSEGRLDLIHTSPSDKQDVSGGMSRKIAHAFEIARYCHQCHIAGGLIPGVLAKLLKGQEVTGTRIVAS